MTSAEQLKPNTELKLVSCVVASAGRTNAFTDFIIYHKADPSTDVREVSVLLAEKPRDDCALVTVTQSLSHIGGLRSLADSR